MGGNARHRHQLSSSGGGSRTGEKGAAREGGKKKKRKGANCVGRVERIQPRHTAEQQSEKDEESGAGDNRGKRKR